MLPAAGTVDVILATRGVAFLVILFDSFGGGHNVLRYLIIMGNLVAGSGPLAVTAGIPMKRGR